MILDPLLARLMTLREKTDGGAQQRGGGYWVGDAAGERVVLDDLQAGRLHWWSAHDLATAGIEALEAGNRSEAETYAWAATDQYVAALEARLRPSDMGVLYRPAKKRGRPRKMKSPRDFSPG